MNKKINIFITLAAILICVLFLFNYLFFIKYIQQEKNYKIQKERNNITDHLKSILMKYGDNTIENNELTSNTIIRDSLEVYELRYNENISMFNNDKIKCDKQKTYFQITVENNIKTFDVFLSCEFK